MSTVVRTGGLQGIDGCAVTVEVDLCRGLPAFHLVGLPNTAVRESRERVLAAVRNSGYRLPAGRVTVNLAPADERKEGSGHDLAIAVALIAAERSRLGEPGDRTDRGLLLGELSLFGEVRPVRGLLPIVLAARDRGETLVTVPASQAWEAGLVPGVSVVPVQTLGEAVRWFLGGVRPDRAGADRSAASTAPSPATPDIGGSEADAAGLQLAQQPLAARAAELAAAGGHHMLLVGPPGSGKTRLARLLVLLLPDLCPAEALTVTCIHSAAGLLRRAGLMRRPPLRAPHHSITTAGLLGGGANLRPGEVTLAHHGVLLLDELAEFNSRTLDALREPLVDGTVRLARGAGQRQLPARFQLVAATNPCRCGFLGSRVRPCSCSGADLARHRARLSGPLRDRFDLVVEMGDGRPLDLAGVASSERPLGDRRGRIARARALLATITDAPAHWSLGQRVRGYGLDAAAIALLESSRLPLGLTIRGVLRVCRVARTVAALDGRLAVTVEDLREGLLFRQDPWTATAVGTPAVGPRTSTDAC